MPHNYLVVRERSRRNTDGTYSTAYAVSGRYHSLHAAIVERSLLTANGNYWIIEPKTEAGFNSANLDLLEADFVDTNFSIASECISIRREPICDGSRCGRCPTRYQCAEWIG